MPSDFQKVGDSKEPMIGKKMLLVGGFEERELFVLREKVGQSRLADIPLRLVYIEEEESFLKDVLDSEEMESGGLIDKRFLLMSGFSDKELKVLLNGYKKWKLPKTLFATATPVNLQWPLYELLDELASEAAAMS